MVLEVATNKMYNILTISNICTHCPVCTLSFVCPGFQCQTLMTSTTDSAGPISLSMPSNIALQSFSLNNNIREITPQDEIFRFDVEADKRINREVPWTKE